MYFPDEPYWMYGLPVVPSDTSITVTIQFESEGNVKPIAGLGIRSLPL